MAVVEEGEDHDERGEDVVLLFIFRGCQVVVGLKDKYAEFKVKL